MNQKVLTRKLLPPWAVVAKRCLNMYMLLHSIGFYIPVYIMIIWFKMTTASSSNSHLVRCDLAAFRTAKCVNLLKSVWSVGPNQELQPQCEWLTAFSGLCSVNWTIIYICAHFFCVGLISLRSCHFNKLTLKPGPAHGRHHWCVEIEHFCEILKQILFFFSLEMWK